MFKKWDEYHGSELLEIYNSDNWEDFLETQYAYNGFPLLPSKPPKTFDETVPEPTETYFSIAGLNVKTAEDAAKVVELVESLALLNVDYQIYGHNYIEPLTTDRYDYPKIEAYKAYSKADWNDLADDLRSIEKRKEIWESQRKEYKQAVKERSELLGDIMDAVNKEQAAQHRKVELERAFEKYISLASGDKKIAKQFLEANYTALVEEFPEVLED